MTYVKINTDSTSAYAYSLYLRQQGVIVVKDWQEGNTHVYNVVDPPAGYTYNLRSGLSQGYQNALFANEQLEKEQILKQQAQQEFREKALASGTGQSVAQINPQTGLLEGYETYTPKTTSATAVQPFKPEAYGVFPVSSIEASTQPQPPAQPKGAASEQIMNNFALTKSFYQQPQQQPLFTQEQLLGYGWVENTAARAQFAETPQVKIAYTLTEGAMGFGTLFSYGESVLAGESYQTFYEREAMKRQLWLRQGEVATQEGRGAEFYFGSSIQGAAAVGLGMAGSGLLGGTAKAATSYAMKSIVGTQLLYTAQTMGSEESGRNVAGLFILGAAESLGRMPVKYTEVRIPVEQTDKVVWRGITLEIGKWAEPVVGMNAERVVSVRTPAIDFSLADQGKPIIPSSLAETEIMRRNLRTQLSPEDFALWNKGTKLPRFTERIPSKDINQLPAKTEALSEKGVASLNAFVKQKGATEYGSYTAYAQRSEKINAGFKTPGDQDIQFALGISDKKAGKMLEQELLPTLRESDQARLAAERKTLVKSKPLEEKDWRHAGDFHTGADAAAEEIPKYKMFGYKLSQPDIKLRSREGELINAMPLSEQGIRDLNIFSLQVKEGVLTFGPEEKRLKDIPKFIIDQRQLIESKWSPRARGKALAQLDEIEVGLRARFPEAFKELNQGKPISEPPSYPRVSRPAAYDASLAISKLGMMKRYTPKQSKSRSDASLRAISLSRSPSPSRSASFSIPASKSPSPSISISLSLSRSKSPSLSKSMSPSPSKSRSPSPSQSYSPSPSPSPSPGRSKPKSYASLGLGKAESKGKAHMTDSERKQLFGYYASLTGLFSGKSISKVPKGTLTGVEIRYPVRRRKMKFL